MTAHRVARIATRRDFIRAARLQRPGEVLEDSQIVDGMVTRVERYREGPALRGDHVNNLDIAEAVLGHHAAAQRHFSDALALRRDALGDDNPQVIYAMGNLGHSYIESSDLDEAVRLLRTALLAAEPSLGPRHPHIALLAINLGYAHRWLAQFTEATRHLGRALELQTEQFGADSPELHYVLQLLGDVALDQRRCEEAAAYHGRALALLEAGDQKPAATNALIGLGRAASCEGDLPAAMLYLERAQAVAIANHGADELVAARVLEAIGDVDRKAGRLDQALTRYERAHTIYRAKLGPSASDLAESQRRIGAAQRQRHDLVAATAAAEKALQIYADDGSTDSLATVGVRALLGELALERGEPALANTHFEGAAAMLAASADPDNAELALLRFGMARALAVQAGGPTPAARALAEQALATL